MLYVFLEKYLSYDSLLSTPTKVVDELYSHGQIFTENVRKVLLFFVTYFGKALSNPEKTKYGQGIITFKK